MNTISPVLKFFLDLSKFHATVSRRFASQGLGFADIAVMYAIHQAPGGKIRRVDLANALGLTASGVTRMLLPLEKIGVIRREENDRDARVSLTVLTTSGKRMLEESLQSAEELCHEMVSHEKSFPIQEFTNFMHKLT